MQNVPLDHYLPSQIISVLESITARTPAGSRVSRYRVPLVHYNLAIGKIMNRVSGPFQPTLLGIPVEYTTKSVPEAVIVQE